MKPKRKRRFPSGSSATIQSLLGIAIRETMILRERIPDEHIDVNAMLASMEDHLRESWEALHKLHIGAFLKGTGIIMTGREEADLENSDEDEQ